MQPHRAEPRYTHMAIGQTIHAQSCNERARSPEVTRFSRPLPRLQDFVKTLDVIPGGRGSGRLNFVTLPGPRSH